MATRSKYYPKFTARKESLSFYVKDCKHFVEKAEYQYKQTYHQNQNKLITVWEDNTNKQGDNECTIIRLKANENTSSLFVQQPPPPTATQQTPPPISASGDDTAIDPNNIVAPPSSQLSEPKEDLIEFSQNTVGAADVVNQEVATAAATTAGGNNNKILLEAGTDFIIISVFWQTCKITIVGEVEILEWFKDIEFPVLCPDPGQECSSSGATAAKKTSKIPAPTANIGSPPRKLRDPSETARIANLERTFNKIDDTLTNISNETNANLISMIEEFHSLRVSVINKDEEISRLSLQVKLMETQVGNKIKALEESKINPLLLAMEQKENENQQLMKKLQAMNDKRANKVEGQITQIQQALNNISICKCSKGETQEELEEEPRLVVKEEIINLNMVGDWESWNGRADTMYISRKKWSLEQSKWYNPFHIEDIGNGPEARRKSIERFERYVRGEEELMDTIIELDEKQLGCYCKPHECHGYVLLKILKEQKDNAAHLDSPTANQRHPQRYEETSQTQQQFPHQTRNPLPHNNSDTQRHAVSSTDPPVHERLKNVAGDYGQGCPSGKQGPPHWQHHNNPPYDQKAGRVSWGECACVAMW